MDTTKEAIAVLGEAERRLRELVGAAAAEGEYDAIQRVTSWARTVGALAQEAQQSGRAGSIPADEAAGGTPGAVTWPSTVRRRADNNSGVSQRISGVPARRSKRLPVKGEYPKFFRRGDQLVKIGWSKKEKEEYEHKAPRRVVDALVTAIVRRSVNGKLFMVEDLLPLNDPDGGTEIPSYQAYVTLAWFKLAGVVKQHGRRGYSVGRASHLADAVGAFWQQLPERNS